MISVFISIAPPTQTTNDN